MSSVTDRLIQFLQLHAPAESAPELDPASFLSAHRVPLPITVGHEDPGQKIQRFTQRHIQTKLLRAMQELLTCFQSHGIGVLFLKGPLLGLELYGETGIRPTSDLDLFVADAQVADALDALTQLGYTRTNGTPYSGKDRVYELNRGDMRLKMMGRHLSAVRSSGNWTITVELHATLFRHYTAISPASLESQANRIFSDSRSISCQGIDYPVPGVLDSFLMLCTHFARHTVEALTAFCARKQRPRFPLHQLHDLALFFEHWSDALSASDLWARALVFGSQADLAFACRYLHEIYGIDLWRSIAPYLSDKPDDDFENDIVWSILRQLSAAELLFCAPSDNLARLQSVVPVRRCYELRNVRELSAVPADYEVREVFDDLSRPPLREPYSFRWGAACSDEQLMFCVEIPTDRVVFLGGCQKNLRRNCTRSDCPKDCAAQHGANTLIRLLLPGTHCPTEAGSCMNLYEISMIQTADGLRLTADRNGHPFALSGASVTEKDGFWQLRFLLPIPDSGVSNALPFMISREILLPFPHRPEQAIAFSVRWLNSVAVSHQTCLSCGLLRKSRL